MLSTFRLSLLVTYGAINDLLHLHILLWKATSHSWQNIRIQHTWGDSANKLCNKLFWRLSWRAYIPMLACRPVWYLAVCLQVLATEIHSGQTGMPVCHTRYHRRAHYLITDKIVSPCQICKETYSLLANKTGTEHTSKTEKYAMCFVC